MPSPRIEQLRNELQRVKSSASALRRNTGGKGAPAMRAGSVLAGAALSGAIDGKLMPGGIAGQPASAIVGGVLIVGGIFGLKGRLAEHAINVGSGMLAPTVADLVGDAVGDDVAPLSAVNS